MDFPFVQNVLVVQEEDEQVDEGLRDQNDFQALESEEVFVVFVMDVPVVVD